MATPPPYSLEKGEEVMRKVNGSGARLAERRGPPRISGSAGRSHERSLA